MSIIRYEPKFGMESLFPPCDLDTLDDFIRQTDRHLPNEYRDFLVQWNGVFFPEEEPAIRFLDKFDDYDFAQFCRLYGFSSQKPLHDLRYAGEAYDFQYRVPSWFVPIGDDNSWNRLCMCLDNNRFGHVYFWQPGVPWEDERKNEQTEEYLRPVATSFLEFWNSLRVPDFPPD